MTIEEKAIANLKYAIRWNDKPTQKSMEMAIASLEAWDKVKREIREYFKEGVMDGDVITTHLCEIIDKHLQEVNE